MAVNLSADNGSADAAAFDQFSGYRLYPGLWYDYGGNYYYDHSICTDFLPYAEEFRKQYDGFGKIEEKIPWNEKK